jgi:hypothetical protein
MLLNAIIYNRRFLKCIIASFATVDDARMTYSRQPHTYEADLAGMSEKRSTVKGKPYVALVLRAFMHLQGNSFAVTIKP